MELLCWIEGRTDRSCWMGRISVIRSFLIEMKVMFTSSNFLLIKSDNTVCMVMDWAWGWVMGTMVVVLGWCIMNCCESMCYN